MKNPNVEIWRKALPKLQASKLGSFAQNLHKSPKLLKLLKDLIKIMENMKVNVERLKLTSGCKWRRNNLLPPTLGPFIGGWPDHLRQPNVKPKPCNVRRPKVTFGGRTFAFLPCCFSFKTQVFETWKQVKIPWTIYALPFSRVPTPKIPPDYRNSDAGLEPGITFSPP